MVGKWIDIELLRLAIGENDEGTFIINATLK